MQHNQSNKYIYHQPPRVPESPVTGVILVIDGFYFRLALDVHVKYEPSIQQILGSNPGSASYELCGIGQEGITEIRYLHL